MPNISKKKLRKYLEQQKKILFNKNTPETKMIINQLNEISKKINQGYFDLSHESKIEDLWKKDIKY